MTASVAKINVNKASTILIFIEYCDSGSFNGLLMIRTTELDIIITKKVVKKMV